MVLGGFRGFYERSGSSPRLDNYSKITEGFNFFKYYLVFKGFVQLSDLYNGTIDIFKMKELVDNYKLYLKGENYLMEKSNG